MIKLFIVFDEHDNVVAGLYTVTEAKQFITQAGIYKDNTDGWYYKEYVLGNNADKFAKAMFG